MELKEKLKQFLSVFPYPLNGDIATAFPDQSLNEMRKMISELRQEQEVKNERKNN